MQYLADILTFFRLVLAIVLFLIAGMGGSPEAAFIVFSVAELTDAFDGTCARKWPFPKGSSPKYRRFAARFDMFADILLAGAQVLFFTLRINWVVGLLIIIYYLVSAALGDLLIYGKILGHPDDYRKNALIAKNFPLAKRIILTRRYLYVLCLGLVSIIILFATSWPSVVKYSLLALGLGFIVFAWFFLRQRRQHISRDAVGIEEKLTQKSRQSSQPRN